MQIFTLMLKHKSKPKSSLHLLLLLLWLVTANLYSANSSEFIHLNPALNDEFYNQVKIFSKLSTKDTYKISDIKQASIYLDPKTLIANDNFKHDLNYYKGIQYAWKSPSTNGQRFFDYINYKKAMATPSSYKEHIKNASNYNIYLGLTTFKQNIKTKKNSYFGLYIYPKLELDFNKGMLNDLFNQSTAKDNTTTINSLIITGIIDGRLSQKHTKNSNAFIVSNSSTNKKILCLPDGLIIAKTGKIQTKKHNTGLKLTDENVILAGNIYNYGEITAGTAVKLGKKDKSFPLIDSNSNTSTSKSSYFYNYGTIKAKNIAFEINGSDNTDTFYLENSLKGEISGKLQSNGKIIFSVSNTGTIKVPAEENAIYIGSYTGKDHSKLIIKFDDDNFGVMPEDTTIINLRNDFKISPNSQIILATTNNEMPSYRTQEEIILINTIDGLFTIDEAKPIKDFSKNIEDILFSKLFTYNSKKFVIAPTSVKIDKKDTQLKASFKIIEVQKDTPEIISLKNLKDQLAKTNKYTDLKTNNKTIEPLTFNKNTSSDYYKNLIDKLIKTETIQQVQLSIANNSIINEEHLEISKYINAKNIITTTDTIKNDTKIAYFLSLKNQLTFECLDNITKLYDSSYDLSNSTLFLGLTVYKNLGSDVYKLGLFDYIRGDNTPAFELDLGYTNSFNKITMDNNCLKLKNIIVTSKLDTRLSQQPALYIHNSYDKDKNLHLIDGLIIANTGKLLASNKNNSKAALYISSNKEESLLNKQNTAVNEPFTTKYMMHGNIYNYGLISGNIAISIGDYDLFFPLKADDENTTLYNEGKIISNNIAVKISGIKSRFTEVFSLINEKQGIIEGKLQKDKYNANDPNDIEFNIINNGTIKIPAENHAINADNYKNTKDSCLIIDFIHDAINPYDALINIGQNAEFDLNSSVIFDFNNYSVNVTNNNIIHIPLLYSEKFSGDKDKLFYIQPVIKDHNYTLYNVSINSKSDFSKEIELCIISKEVFNLKENPYLLKSFPHKPINIKNISNKIKILKMIADASKTSDGLWLKQIHDLFIGTYTGDYAFENSNSLEEYLDSLNPDNSNSLQMSSYKISNNVKSHINSRIMNKSLYTRYVYLQEGTNLSFNHYADNFELWSSASYHLWDYKQNKTHNYNQIKTYILSIGSDYELKGNILMGIAYAINHTNTTSHKTAKNTDEALSHAVSLYGRFILEDINIFASTSYSYNKHNLTTPIPKKQKFKSSASTLNIGATYEISFYHQNIGITGAIGIVNLKVDSYKHNQSTTIKQQKDRIFNASIGSSIYDKISVFDGMWFDYCLSLNYTFFTGPKTPKTDSEIINSFTSKYHVHNCHNFGVNALTKLLVNENATIELMLDYAIEKHSYEYGVSLTLKYAF